VEEFLAGILHLDKPGLAMARRGPKNPCFWGTPIHPMMPAALRSF